MRIREFVLSSAAIAAVTAMAAAGGDELRLEDVQIGEAGNVMRIALICNDECVIAPEPGATFMISGVDAAFDIDLTKRSRLASRLVISPVAGGSMLRLTAAADINEARVIECRSETGAAPCIELRFSTSHKKAPAAPAPRPVLREDAAKAVETGAPAPQKEVQTNRDDIPFLGAAVLAPSPHLRDGPEKGELNLRGFEAPVRLTPDDGGKTSAPPKVELRSDLGAEIEKFKAAYEPKFDITGTAQDILGRNFDVGACEGAKARLSADAWALDAMVDLAYCKAAKGDLDSADADLRRLLAYTPDNYEALLGRGLIALAKGDRDRGLALMQDSLNSLPPLAEATRISAAMRKL
ncbi:MAG: hypothetical protein R3C60_02480 [Parvularculaceae bacterium]